jgi:hypothetical protein
MVLRGKGRRQRSVQSGRRKEGEERKPQKRKQTERSEVTERMDEPRKPAALSLEN